MEFNPLLAMLNSAGSTSTAKSNVGGEVTVGTPSSVGNVAQSASSHSSTPSEVRSPHGSAQNVTASASAASALLQSLLSPPSSAQASEKQGKNYFDAGTPTHRSSSNGSADLLALLGGGGGGGGGTQKPTQSSPPTTSKSPLRIGRASAHPTVFDFQSPFDLLNQAPAPQQQEEGQSEKRIVDESTTLRSPQPNDLAQKESRENAGFVIEAEEQFEVTSDRNLRAFRHLAGLRASSGFDNVNSSGLDEVWDDEVVTLTMDLLAPQPAGAESIYPAKIEITPISILKTVQKQIDQVSVASYPQKGRWIGSGIVGACGDLVCYVTGRTKVRIIDEKTGERAVITANGPVRSLFVNDASARDRTTFRLGIVTDTSVGIWSLGDHFGRVDNSARMVWSFASDDNRSLVHASFLRDSNNQRLIVVQNDGLARIVSIGHEVAVPVASHDAKIWQTLSEPNGTERALVALCQSSDGSLIASIYGSKGSDKPLTVVLASTIDKQLNERIELPSLKNIELFEVSFAALVAPPHDSTRALLLGFNRNSVLAFIDLVNGEYKRVYHLDGKAHAHFNLVQWHYPTATLIVSNSLRSSVFTLRPFAHAERLRQIDTGNVQAAQRHGVEVGEVLDDAASTIERIRTKQVIWTFDDDVRPAMKESVLPEVWMSFYVDQQVSAHLRLTAYHAGGIQTVNLPEEAVRQNVKVSDNIADGFANLRVSETMPALGEQSAPSEMKADVSAQKDIKTTAELTDTTSTSGDDRLARLLSDVERNILSSISALPHVTTQQQQRQQQDRTSITTSSHQLSPTLVQDLASQLIPKMQESIRQEVDRIVSDTVAKTLPAELRNALIRPDLSAHLQRSISTSIVAPIQRTAMDVVTHALAPHFEDVVGDLTQKVERSIEQHMTNVRKDIVTEQGKALLESEAAVRDLARQMGQLTSMIESLSRQNAKMERALNEVREEQKVLGLNSIRAPSASAPLQGGLNSIRAPSASTPSQGGAKVHAPSSVVAPPSFAVGSNGPALSSSIVETSTASSSSSSGPNVEDTLLAVLSVPTIEQDASPLQNTLAQLEKAYGSAYAAIRSPPPNNTLRLSQAVLLALLHRLIKTLSTGSSSLSPEQSIVWIEATSAACDRNDAHIAPVFEGVRREMIDNLVRAHRHLTVTHRTPWWTPERLFEGTLRYIQ